MYRQVYFPFYHNVDFCLEKCRSDPSTTTSPVLPSRFVSPCLVGAAVTQNRSNPLSPVIAMVSGNGFKHTIGFHYSAHSLASAGAN
jgi:hypothetical protein